MAYAGSLSHVVLTAFTRSFSYIPSPNKNTGSALVHPNLYLNTVYIICGSLVGPEPYLRRHTPFITAKSLGDSLRSFHSSLPRIPTSRSTTWLLYNPDGRHLGPISPPTPSVPVLSPFACSFSIRLSGGGTEQLQTLSIRRERTFHAADASPTGRIYTRRPVITQGDGAT